MGRADQLFGHHRECCPGREAYAGYALSQHAIRIRAVDANDAGFVAAFLRSRFGRPQLVGASYGSVVVHIEPEHLRGVLIPRLHPVVRAAIGGLMREARERWDEANRLLDRADTDLHRRIGLDSVRSIVARRTAIGTTVNLHELEGRFDAHYHDPAARLAEAELRTRCPVVVALGDPRLTQEIRAITKFRKRVYVEQGGIPMLSSKQILQIAPIDTKHLAKGAHTKDLPEIALRPGMVLVTCSGTIGRVQIVPDYMDGWTASQDSTRLLAGAGTNPGFLYAWLASDYGQALLTRQSYGAVVVHIDRDMIASVPVPLPDAAAVQAIGDLVLAANDRRNEAWQKEQLALSRLAAAIETPTPSGQGRSDR